MKVLLRNVRLSFPDLFEAVQFQGQGPFQYRAAFLMTLDQPSYKDVKAAIEKVALEKWQAKAAGLLKAANATQKICFIDGDTKAYNGYAGNWVLSSTRDISAGKPIVVDRAKNPVSANDGMLYAGCYVNATVEMWAQDNSFGKTVRATLINVQFVRDGESFGGAAPATVEGLDDLGYEEDDESAEEDYI